MGLNLIEGCGYCFRRGFDRLLLDFDPGPNGVERQVIIRFDIGFYPLAKSWYELMEKTVAGLENGSIVPMENGPERNGWVTRTYHEPGGRPVSPLECIAEGPPRPFTWRRNSVSGWGCGCS